jgi:hypothetical protein
VTPTVFEFALDLLAGFPLHRRPGAAAKTATAAIGFAFRRRGRQAMIALLCRCE